MLGACVRSDLHFFLRSPAEVVKTGSMLTAPSSARILFALSAFSVNAAFMSLTLGLSLPARFTMDAFTRLRYFAWQP